VQQLRPWLLFAPSYLFRILIESFRSVQWMFVEFGFRLGFDKTGSSKEADFLFGKRFRLVYSQFECLFKRSMV
jgi:hypothetical protein